MFYNCLIVGACGLSFIVTTSFTLHNNPRRWALLAPFCQEPTAPHRVPVSGAGGARVSPLSGGCTVPELVPGKRLPFPLYPTVLGETWPHSVPAGLEISSCGLRVNGTVQHWFGNRLLGSIAGHIITCLSFPKAISDVGLPCPSFSSRPVTQVRALGQAW